MRKMIQLQDEIEHPIGAVLGWRNNPPPTQFMDAESTRRQIGLSNLLPLLKLQAKRMVTKASPGTMDPGSRSPSARQNRRGLVEFTGDSGRMRDRALHMGAPRARVAGAPRRQAVEVISFTGDSGRMPDRAATWAARARSLALSDGKPSNWSFRTA